MPAFQVRMDTPNRVKIYEAAKEKATSQGISLASYLVSLMAKDLVDNKLITDNLVIDNEKG